MKKGSDLDNNLFPLKSMYMALKLTIWIAQANQERPNEKVTQMLVAKLPQSVIKEACEGDPKL